MPRTKRKISRPPKFKGRSVAELYVDFEKAEAACRTRPEGKHYDRAIGKAGRLAREVARAPADGVVEMLLKIRVAAWDFGVNYEDLEELDAWEPPTPLHREIHHEVLASLREDLRHLVINGTVAFPARA